MDGLDTGRWIEYAYRTHQGLGTRQGLVTTLTMTDSHNDGSMLLFVSSLRRHSFIRDNSKFPPLPTRRHPQGVSRPSRLFTGICFYPLFKELDAGTTALPSARPLVLAKAAANQAARQIGAHRAMSTEAISVPVSRRAPSG